MSGESSGDGGAAAAGNGTDLIIHLPLPLHCFWTGVGKTICGSRGGPFWRGGVRAALSWRAALHRREPMGRACRCSRQGVSRGWGMYWRPAPPPFELFLAPCP